MISRNRFDFIAAKFLTFIQIISTLAAVISTIDLFFKPTGTTLIEAICQFAGVVLPMGSHVAASIMVLIVMLIVLYLINCAKRHRNRNEGLGELANACCIHTLRLVTLVQGLRDNPNRSSNSIDCEGLYGIPVESARYCFRIKNVGLIRNVSRRSLLTSEQDVSDVMEDKAEQTFIASDVEYDFRLKLAKRAMFSERYPLVSWIFGDDGHQPENFAFYYTDYNPPNLKPAKPRPYKNSSFSYMPHEGLYVVSHSVCPSYAGPDRIFGMHYEKQYCLSWDFEDDLTIYPTAIAGDTGKARFRVELQKLIYDALKPVGGVSFELYEFYCSGKKAGKGRYPAHFENKGSFVDDQEYILFETPEIPIDPENVYIVQIKSYPAASDALRHMIQPNA